MSRSRRSFTVQPAPLKSTAPQPNNVNNFMSGKCPGVAAMVIDLMQDYESINMAGIDQ